MAEFGTTLLRYLHRLSLRIAISVSIADMSCSVHVGSGNESTHAVHKRGLGSAIMFVAVAPCSTDARGAARINRDHVRL